MCTHTHTQMPQHPGAEPASPGQEPLSPCRLGQHCPLGGEPRGPGSQIIGCRDKHQGGVVCAGSLRAHLIPPVDSAFILLLLPTNPNTMLCPSSSSSPLSSPSQSCLLAPRNRVGTTAETDGTTQRSGDTPDRRRHQCHQMCLEETTQPSCLVPVNPRQHFLTKDRLNPPNPSPPAPGQVQSCSLSPGSPQAKLSHSRSPLG